MKLFFLHKIVLKASFEIKTLDNLYLQNHKSNLTTQNQNMHFQLFFF